MKNYNLHKKFTTKQKAEIYDKVLISLLASEKIHTKFEYEKALSESGEGSLQQIRDTLLMLQGECEWYDDEEYIEELKEFASTSWKINEEE